MSPPWTWKHRERRDNKSVTRVTESRTNVLRKEVYYENGAVR